MEADKDELLKFSPKLSSIAKDEINNILVSILPDNYLYLIVDFEIVAPSKIAGETKFKTTFRVNIDDKEGIDTFITEFGKKS